MLVACTLALATAIHLRQPVSLPFPDADKALAELNEQNQDQNVQPPALVEQATAASATQGSDDAVAAWTPPTLAPDPAIMTTDQFKHPTAQQLKDWESAPKIDMFEEPTIKPISLATEKKPATADVPKVESKIHPVNPYGHKDEDPELSAIQQESPEAYGIVKALLMKKQMGLPMPGQDAAKKESDAARSFGSSQEAGPSSSAHIGNMFAWKPPDSAADDLSAIEDTASVSKTVVEDPEPKAEPQAEPQAEVEEPQAEPQAEAKASKIKDMFSWKPASADADAQAAPAAAEAPAAAPKEESTDSDQGIALNSWLGASAPVTKVAQPQESSSKQSSGSWGNDMMSRYAADLA